jgi:hypothetical protein
MKLISRRFVEARKSAERGLRKACAVENVRGVDYMGVRFPLAPHLLR